MHISFSEFLVMDQDILLQLFLLLNLKQNPVKQKSPEFTKSRNTLSLQNNSSPNQSTEQLF